MWDEDPAYLEGYYALIKRLLLLIFMVALLNSLRSSQLHWGASDAFAEATLLKEAGTLERETEISHPSAGGDFLAVIDSPTWPTLHSVPW